MFLLIVAAEIQRGTHTIRPRVLPGSRFDNWTDAGANLQSRQRKIAALVMPTERV